MGVSSGCPAQSFPELTCKMELPCDESIPVVEIELVLQPEGGQSVEITWRGLDATDTVEFLITGKFLDQNDDPLIPFYELNDYEALPDEAYGVTGITIMGAFVVDRVYMISARRIRNGKVSLWTHEIAVGVAGDHAYLVDGVDIMVDDYIAPSKRKKKRLPDARVAPTIIIDDEVP